MIGVRDLKPGERVVIECPEADEPKHEAVFEGIFPTKAQAVLTRNSEATVMLVGMDERIPGDGEWSWARFLLGASLNQGGSRFVLALFRVKPNGEMVSSDDLKVFVAERMVMGKG